MGHSSDNASSVELNSNFNIEDEVWTLWNLFKMKFLVKFDTLKKLVDSTVLSWMGHLDEWVIQVNGGHLSEWVIWANVAFKWRGHSSEWGSFEWMGHSSEGVIQVNGSFVNESFMNGSFTYGSFEWMGHSRVICKWVIWVNGSAETHFQVNGSSSEWVCWKRLSSAKWVTVVIMHPW